MNPKLLNVGLVVLTVIALVLGYFVYEKFAPVRITPKPEAGLLERMQQTGTDVPNYADMTDAELVSALPNPADVPAEAMTAFAGVVTSRAVSTNRVSIGAGCAADPKIVDVAVGDTVTFVNEDRVVHTLNVTPKHAVRLEPGASAELATDFETGTGMYGYPCDSKAALSGLLILR